MALDIKKLKANTRPFASIETSIGDLYLFQFRIKELIGIEKKLGTKLNELESEEFFRLYLPFFAYLKQDLVGEKLERPEDYTLKAEDINKLLKEELEEIAKLFIEEHSSFYMDWKSSSSKKEDGTPVISLKEEIDESLLKYDDESYVEYVYRLVVSRHKKDQEKARKMFSSFSSGLSSDILKTMGLGESLKSSLDTFSSLGDLTKTVSSKYGSIKQAEPKLPNFDYNIGQEIRDQEKRRLAPFKDLSSKMDLMIETEKQTVSFMSDVYETQVQIANELKTSSDSANENSKLNIKLTRLVILLTAIAVLVSLVSLIYTVWFDNSSKKLVDANQNIKSTIMETNFKIEKLTEVLIEQNKIQSAQIKILREELKSIQSSTVVDSNKSVPSKNISD